MNSGLETENLYDVLQMAFRLACDDNENTYKAVHHAVVIDKCHALLWNDVDRTDDLLWSVPLGVLLAVNEASQLDVVVDLRVGDHAEQGVDQNCDD